ncbi:Gfo/Idh/MocA family protein [Candidatus Nitrospira allomarina]|uniref:Gfo/Idh/MocA family oxidoreductase n=1 Tax=Candidatus Nitrospira allomarina TaxID=3020900 RepID=A0AA96G857_9BACT|nr:Gfo/Idh/MocA family oxidoreductase [Candidatus Nitrospira allomarina]WNM56631.1 Gfo/Idh/MocA family oxidoreductase [Candidatus Nitrospira allomarina]
MARSLKRTFPTRKIRYAVVGLGYIAQVAVLPAFGHAKKNSALAALISDDPKKLKELGKKYGINGLYSYEQYEECLEKEEIDAVYIALPNHLHCEYTIRAAKAGVHVLCEKPMALSVKECETMIRTADHHDVKLMVAYRLHFEEANLRAIQMVQSGKIGTPRYFQSAFSLPVKDKNNIRLREETGGGTLWDIGIYCVNAARNLFQAEPIQVFAHTAGQGTGRFDEVEEMSAVTLQFPDDRLATFICSFGAADVSEFRIVGTKGQLRVTSAYEYVDPITHYLTVNGKENKHTFSKRDQFAPQLLKFSDCIVNDTVPEPAGDEGLHDVRIIEALYRSAHKGQPVPLKGVERKRRPTLRQSLRRPPVKKPRLIHAQSPSGS